LYLLPYLNGSLIETYPNGAEISPGTGYVNITFREIRPHYLQSCRFSVVPLRPEPARQYGLSAHGTGIEGQAEFSSVAQQHQLERIVVLVAVRETVGFASFFTVTEAHVTHGGGWYRDTVRYRAFQDFGIMLVLLMIAAGSLLFAEILGLTRRGQRSSRVVRKDFPYLTLVIFFATTLAYIFFGLVGEDGISDMPTICSIPEPVINYAICAPLNVFSHFNTEHFEGNMFSVLPWQGVTLGLLPVGFIAESILRVRRRLVLGTYFLSSYLAIVGVRYGSIVPGYGASLSVYGLAGLCVVASYHCLFSAQIHRGGRLLRITRFCATLYVGFAIVSYLSGYLYPIALSRFAQPISSWLSPMVTVDALSHVVSVVVPMIVVAFYCRKTPRKLFRSDVVS